MGIKKLNDKTYCKLWLSAKPAKGFVMPGDKCDIDIEIYVNKKTAGDLNCGHDQLYDILVLHLHGGKDIFITISAYSRTIRWRAFGNRRNNEYKQKGTGWSFT